MHREVEVEVEASDKGGNFIGWLYIEGKNLSVTLVEVREGLSVASVCVCVCEDAPLVTLCLPSGGAVQGAPSSGAFSSRQAAL